MSRHEDFIDVTIEVPISGTNEKLIVKKHFWDDLRQQGATVVFMHAGRPHVSDPVLNDRKLSVARLVMKCEAGFSARIKNPDDPFNLTPDNLIVVKDGRAQYRARLSAKPEEAIKLGVEPSKLIHPDCIDRGVGEDIEEELPCGPDEPKETDQPLDEADLIVVIKDGHGLEGGLRSSRRVSTSHIEKDGSNLDTPAMQMQMLVNDMARRNGAILPTKGPKCKRFSKSYFNSGKVHKS